METVIELTVPGIAALSIILLQTIKKSVSISKADKYYSLILLGISFFICMVFGFISIFIYNLEMQVGLINGFMAWVYATTGYQLGKGIFTKKLK